MKKLVKKIKMNSTIELLTGLHIGGNSDNVEIGGIDNPVIKIATKDNQPYIPGSSLKGKMRCLLEQIAGATEVGRLPRIRHIREALLSNEILHDVPGIQTYRYESYYFHYRRGTRREP